ncbi:MAG: glycosyltransferase, partial [Candidatus Methylomirabilales bacterium]
PRLTWQIHRLLTRERVELVNTHSSVDSWVASPAARLIGVPVLRTRHLAGAVPRNPLSTQVYRRLCDRVVTTGEFARRRLVAETGVPPEKVVVIPTGIDMAAFDPDQMRGDGVRAEWGIAPGTPLVGVVAVLRRRKGHAVLVEACLELRGAFPGLHVVLVGDGPVRGWIAERIRDLGLEGTVRLVGHRRDIPDVLAALDVFVLPSIEPEGVPQSVVQALAMGRPVVASDVEGLTEVLRDGETGLLVPPGDPAALAAAIASLLADPGRGTALGNAGRQLVKKEFTVEAMLGRLEGLYAQMLTRHRANSRSVVPSSPPGS